MELGKCRFLYVKKHCSEMEKLINLKVLLSENKTENSKLPSKGNTKTSNRLRDEICGKINQTHNEVCS